MSNAEVAGIIFTLLLVIGIARLFDYLDARAARRFEERQQ